jgi:hypothetical protein
MVKGILKMVPEIVGRHDVGNGKINEKWLAALSA